MLSELRPIYQGCLALPFVLARLSHFYLVIKCWHLLNKCINMKMIINVYACQSLLLLFYFCLRLFILCFSLLDLVLLFPHPVIVLFATFAEKTFQLDVL